MAELPEREVASRSLLYAHVRRAGYQLQDSSIRKAADDEQAAETPVGDTLDGQVAIEPTPETEPDNAPEDGDGDGDDKGDIAKARAQAAKYRARLRETEQQRDALSERLSQADDHIIGYALARACDAPPATHVK